MNERQSPLDKKQPSDDQLNQQTLPQHTEIERRWLVQEIPPLDELVRFQIEQGYLTIGAEGSETRIRQKGSKYTITVKSGDDLAHPEFEIAITREQFEYLWGATEGKRVYKVRYEIPVGNLTIELDVYSGKRSGLVVAEVEFSSVEEAREFVPPSWFGEEITSNPAYRNRNLAG